MSRLSTLSQGPLGVAASASPPARRPGRASHTEAASGEGHAGDYPPPPPGAPARTQTGSIPAADGRDAGVSPSTLLMASQLAVSLGSPRTASFDAATLRNGGWTPPPSLLALRDRKV
ncbi:hypothetical protein [Pelagibacterium montanilacus]|uniref:hypothetical protein n=1 Tax=Pelagibacterium montanilacus TaxID=2185280 RepID=UPI000F8E3E6E|nr:hypothetical protein [Pelagibacterium montanilacus]